MTQDEKTVWKEHGAEEKDNDWKEFTEYSGITYKQSKERDRIRKSKIKQRVKKEKFQRLVQEGYYDNKMVHPDFYVQNVYGFPLPRSINFRRMILTLVHKIVYIAFFDNFIKII